MTKQVRHYLKVGDDYLRNLTLGRKKAEVRLNDRDYQVGDILEFRVFDNDEYLYFSFKITHIHSGLGLKEGYVVLSLEGEKK